MNDDLFYEEIEPESGVNTPEKKHSSALAPVSLISGIAGVLLWVTPYIAVPCVVCALVCSIVSMRRDKACGMNIAGLVLGITGLIICTAVIAVSVYLMSNPELLQQFMEMYQEMYSGS